MLFTLQQKLTRIKDLKSFIFVAIRELYYSRETDNIEKTFVYNISIIEYLAEYVADRLQNKICSTRVTECIEKIFAYNKSEERYLAEYVVSKLQNKIYYIRVIEDVEIMFIYSVNNNIIECWTIHTRDMLSKIIIATI